MLLPSFFILLLTTLAIIWLWLSMKSSSSIQSTNDYFLAGRQLGVAPISLTLMATQVGGGFLSGIAQESYATGFYGILYALGISSGFLLLGSGIAGRLRELHVETTAEIFKKVYGSVYLQRCASLLFIGSLWGILVAQIVAFKTIVIGLGIISDLFIILFWLSIIIHTVIGGFKAVVSVDNLKQIFIIAIFGGILLYTLPSAITFPLNFSHLFDLQQHYFTAPHTQLLYLLPTFLMPALFSLIEQDLAQCFFAARSKQVAALSAIYASIFLIIFSMAPVYFGMQAKLLNITMSAQANPLIAYLAYVCNDFVFVLAVVALITAITSTANSLLCATSAHIAQDFNLSLNSKHGLRIAQTVTFLTGLAALCAAYSVEGQIVTILTLSYELSATILCVPLIAVYLFKANSKYAAWLSVIFGITSFIIGYLILLSYQRPLFTLSMSVIGFVSGIVLSKLKEC